MSLLSNFVDGHLVFLFFLSTPPKKKKKNWIAPSAASKPQYLPLQFFSPFIVLAKGREVINSAKCQVCDIVILSEWWAPKSLSYLSSPPPPPCCLFLFFLFFSPPPYKTKRNDSLLSPSRQQFSLARSACRMKRSGTSCCRWTRKDWASRSSR